MGSIPSIVHLIQSSRATQGRELLNQIVVRTSREEIRSPFHKVESVPQSNSSKEQAVRVELPQQFNTKSMRMIRPLVRGMVGPTYLTRELTISQ